MEELRNQLIELENQIQNQEEFNLMVSKSSVGWHIEHSLLVMNLTIESIQKTNPQNYKWTFNFKRFIVFMINKIPRGKIRAPKIVQPIVEFNEDSLKNHLGKVRDNLEKLTALSPNNYFAHPFMGNLNLKSTIRFIKLHTQHHISIIKDIIESKK